MKSKEDFINLRNLIMSNLLVTVLGAIMNGQQANSISLNSTASTATNTVSADTPSFSTVLSQLNNNVKFSGLQTNSIDVNSFLNNETSTGTVNLDGIIQKIIADKKNGSTASVDSLIKKYLLKYFGGSETDVIKNIAGVQSLPDQAKAIEKQIFQNSITKISCKIRSQLSYEDDKVKETTDSDYSSDLSFDSSTNSDYYIDFL